MDTKRMMVGILLITALGLGYQYFLLYEYKVHPEWARQGSQPAQTLSAGSTATQPVTTEPATAESAGPGSAPATQPGGWAVSGGPTTQPAITLGSDQHDAAAYHLALAVNPAGAGLNSVVLNEFFQEVDNPELFAFQHPYEEDEAHTRALATMSASIDGTVVNLGDKDWLLQKQSDQSAQYGIQIDQNGKPVLRIDKAYLLEAAQADPNTSQGYEIQVKYHIANLSTEKHAVALAFNGPTVPKAETARQETEIVAGYDNDGLMKIVHLPLGSFRGTAISKDYVPNDDKLPLLWMGATSNYFNAIVRPEKPGELASAVATALNPDLPSDERLVAIRFTTVAFDLPPGKSRDFPLHVFFGPKKRSLLNSHYYSSFPLNYDQTLVLLTNWFCSLCTFPWLIGFLVSVLAGLHFVLRDWGLAIIALVCGVRLLLHPITKRSQVSMMKMQKLAPEMERLKKKFGDDKEGFTKAQMELYKTVGFTPILGCLPMVLQMPIFVALWRALQTTFELRQAPFLDFFGFHLTWIHDLSQPDALIKFAPITLPIVGWHMSAINILPLAMAVVTFINQKYFTPKPAAMSPEQEQQQKMMMWMTLVFPIMFYTFPSGLNLYYLTSTTLGILESKRVRDHIKQREAEQAATGPVIVDAGKMSRRRLTQNSPQTPAKKGWMQKLQEKAEQMVRQAEQNKKRK